MKQRKLKIKSWAFFLCLLQENSRTSRTSFSRTQRLWLASQTCDTVLKLLPDPFPCQASMTIRPSDAESQACNSQVAESELGRSVHGENGKMSWCWNVAGACELEWLEFSSFFPIKSQKSHFYTFLQYSSIYSCRKKGWPPCWGKETTIKFNQEKTFCYVYEDRHPLSVVQENKTYHRPTLDTLTVLILYCLNLCY